MNVAAFIPARGGSKRVPGKNLEVVGGRSLVERAVDAARPWCDTYTVATDDDAIAAHAMLLRDRDEVGLRVFRRAPASDTQQIESVLIEWLRHLSREPAPMPDVIVMLQPTSPFRTADHVSRAIDLLRCHGLDSVVGVTAGHEQHFAGRLKPRDGGWHEWQPFRPWDAPRARTQDLPPMGVENGSVYAFTRSHFERTRNRLGGKMGAVSMSRVEGLDVDTREDVEMARLIADGMGL